MVLAAISRIDIRSADANKLSGVQKAPAPSLIIFFGQYPLQCLGLKMTSAHRCPSPTVTHCERAHGHFQLSVLEPTDHGVGQINKQDCAQQKEQRCEDDIQSRPRPGPHLSRVDVERGPAEPKRRAPSHATQDDQKQSGDVAERCDTSPARIAR